jgi:hypothetical protein
MLIRCVIALDKEENMSCFGLEAWERKPTLVTMH